MLKSDFDKLISIECQKKSSIPQKIYTILFSYGFQAICVYRFGKFLDRYFSAPCFLPIYFIANAFYVFLRSVINLFYGIYIDKKAVIGRFFYIGHFGGINIGSAVIGDNCSIHQNVKIYAAANKDESVTIIGGNVWIGAHSKITQGVKIENNVTLVPGTNLKSDIKIRGALVMGNPGRVIQKYYNNSHLLGGSQ